MRIEVRPDVILWTPDKPEGLPRRWKCWQERLSSWGGRWSAVPGTVAFWNAKPSEQELKRLPKLKNHRWVVGPI